MKSGPVGPEVFRRRLVGLFALTLMDREGPLHGYALSERIALRTEGAWRPGPGAVYPSLGKLVDAGLARSRTRERRREYTVTPKGRAFLRRIRSSEGPWGHRRPDLSALWAEVLGTGSVDGFLLSRLRRTLEALEARMARTEHPTGSGSDLRSAVLAELISAQARLDTAEPTAPLTRSRPRGARRAG